MPAPLRPAPCSTPAPLQPGRLLRNLAGNLLLPVPGAVLNGGPAGFRQAGGAGRDLPATLHGCAGELISWGTALGCARALQRADALVPGLALSVAGYQAFCALSLGARGEFSRAVQHMPFATLAPDALLRHLSLCLQPLLPAWLPGAVALQADVVIGAAVCAVLHRMAQPAGAPPAEQRQRMRLLGALRHLRTACTVLAGLQNVLNAGQSRRLPAQRRIAGPGPVAPGFNATQVAGSHQGWSPLPPMPVDRAAPVAAGPLPGALSRKARPRPAPAPAPATRGTAARARFTIRRLRPVRMPGRRSSNAVERAQHPASLGLPNVRTPSAAMASDNGAKEALMSPANPAKGAGKELHPSHPDERREQARTGGAMRTPATPRPAPASAPSAGASTTAPRPTSPSPTAMASTATSAASPPAQLPACVRFHDTGHAQRQIDYVRLQDRPLRFCVDGRATVALHWAFNTRCAPASDAGSCIIHRVVHEDVPPALRGLAVRRYHSLDHRVRHIPREPQPLGSDALYSVLSLSVLPDSTLRQNGVTGSHVLPRNSLKVIRHTQLDGGERLLIAFFSTAIVEGVERLQAGFVDIEHAHGTFSVSDTRSGYRFASSTLDDLIAGIEQVSGCQSRPDADALALLTNARGVPLSPLQAAHLFIRREATHASTAPYAALAADAAPTLFPQYPFSFAQGRLNASLFRTTFLVVDASVVYVDAQGRPGTLQFASAGPGAELHTLQPHAGFQAQFLREHGLQEGGDYRMDEVARILENYGMSQLALPEIDPVPAASRLDDFHVGDLPAQRMPPSGWKDPDDTDCRLLGVPFVDGTADAPPLPSTFRLYPLHLTYVDHRGQCGELRFRHVAAEDRRIEISQGNSAGALLFAREAGLQPMTAYTPADLRRCLYASGLVHVPT